MSQHKATLRKTMRSAMTHKAAADKIIDSLADVQNKLNATLDKLNVDAAGATPAVAATATLNLTVDAVLTSVATGAARNTNTFTLQVLAAAANPTDTVLVDFTGTATAIVCTVTPNDGTNNAATPVDLTTAELVELINTGAVVGKNITLTDGSSLRTLQTATGGDATALADAGEGDGVVGTFSGGANAIGGLDVNYVASGAITSVFTANMIVAAQNKSSIRNIMRSKLKHKQTADKFVDALAELHSKYNLLLAKLDAEAGTLNDGDYVATLAMSSLSPDSHSTVGVNKATLRRKMELGMSHRRLANLLVDGIANVQLAFNAALVKLDAGTINGQMASLKISAINPEGI